ncbi:MAG: hypothetical protein RLZZ137_189 [Cyanobacteriota bacterium]
MTSLAELAVASWPDGPLTMAALLALEPAGLRRVLKAGLRQGVDDAALRALVAAEFCCEPDAAAVDHLFSQLEGRQWLVRQGTVWKTRLA